MARFENSCYDHDITEAVSVEKRNNKLSNGVWNGRHSSAIGCSLRVVFRDLKVDYYRGSEGEWLLNRYSLCLSLSSPTFLFSQITVTLSWKFNSLADTGNGFMLVEQWRQKPPPPLFRIFGPTLVYVDYEFRRLSGSLPIASLSKTIHKQNLNLFLTEVLHKTVNYPIYILSYLINLLI